MENNGVVGGGNDSSNGEMGRSSNRGGMVQIVPFVFLLLQWGCK